MIRLDFDNPWALLLLLCFVPAVWWARHSLAGLGRGRGYTALVIRTLIFLLLIAALSKVKWSRVQDDLSVVYVIDRSLSIPQAEQTWELEYVLRSQQKRAPDDRVGLVLFGENAALERPLDTKPVLQAAPDAKANESYSLQSLIKPDRTNLAAGIRLGLAALEPGGRRRIVVVSDGNSNVGGLDEEVEACRRNNVRVDVLPITYQYPNEVLIEKVSSPAIADVRATFDVRVVVTTQRPTKGILSLSQNNSRIASEQVDLKTGRNVFTVPRALESAGPYIFTAELEADQDTLHQNNVASSFTFIGGTGRVLVIAGALDEAREFVEALRRKGLEVDLVGREAMPLKLEQILTYDQIIVINMSAGDLGDGGMAAIEQAVKEWGIGFGMIGGPESFGPGGYQDTPIEQCLPVSMDIRQRQIMPKGALVVILHTCEMEKGNYWAQQIALAALNVLGPQDEYGVILYGNMGAEQWLFPLQTCGNKRQMKAAIANCSPGDMPSFAAAFGLAHQGLKASDAAVKHVIVISDGDPAYPSHQALTAMVRDNITISTVGIATHDATCDMRMMEVAKVGRGKWYQVTNANTLPEIFIKEATTVRRSAIVEERLVPRVRDQTELIPGLRDPAPLHGYVMTTAKDGAELPLIAQKEPDPILAHWQYGLGRTFAFTSDATSRWAKDWVESPQFEPFWSQVIRWGQRSVKEGKLRVRAEIEGDHCRMVADAIDENGRFVNDLKISAHLVTPEGKTSDDDLLQTGPGRYETTFETGSPGAHLVALKYKDPEGRSMLQTEGFVVPYSAEYRELTTNERRLQQIAEATKGRVLDEARDEVFARNFEPEPRYSDVWPLLLLYAALLVPLDVFVRRVFLDYAAMGRALVRAGGRLPLIGTRIYKEKATPSHVTQLLGSKQRSRDEIARRGRKLDVKPAPQGEIEETLDLTGQSRPKARVIAPPPGAKGPEVQRDDETYTGRLLKAKKQFRGDQEQQPKS